MNHFPILVPGADDAGSLTVEAPWDRSPIATVGTGDRSAVDTALATAHRLFRDRGAWLKPAERIAILDRAAAIMSDQAEELAVEAAREGGKPLVDSRVEVTRAIDGVRNCIEVLRTDSGRVIPMVPPRDIGRVSHGKGDFCAVGRPTQGERFVRDRRKRFP